MAHVQKFVVDKKNKLQLEYKYLLGGWIRPKKKTLLGCYILAKHHRKYYSNGSAKPRGTHGQKLIK